MSENLQTKTVYSVFWTACERFGALVIQFVVTLILARILSPSDYGLLGMLALFTAIGTLLIDSGFSQALIRKTGVIIHDYSTVFYTNIFLGMLVYVLLFCMTPYIADFYGIPELEDLSKVLFLIFPICALGIIQETILIKELKFKVTAFVAVSSAVVGGCVGVLCALNGYGVWALVYQQLTLYVVKVAMLWCVSRWRPRKEFDFNVLKELSGFSLNLLCIGFINNVFINIYILIIGKYFTVNDAGYYNQARLLEETPATLIVGVVHKATYPILSQIQDDNERLKAGYKRIISMTMFVSLPLLLGMLVMADNLFIVLFSEKWLPSVPIFRILCVYGALYPFHVINTNILRVKGEGRLYLYLEIVKKTLTVLAIVLTIKYGIIPLVWGSVVVSFIAVFFNMHFCGRLINYSILEQLWDISKNLVITLLMMVLVWGIGYIPVNRFFLFFLQIVVGGIFYIGAAKLLKVDSLREYMLIFNKMAGGKNN